MCHKAFLKFIWTSFKLSIFGEEPLAYATLFGKSNLFSVCLLNTFQLRNESAFVRYNLQEKNSTGNKFFINVPSRLVFVFPVSSALNVQVNPKYTPGVGEKCGGVSDNPNIKFAKQRKPYNVDNYAHLVGRPIYVAISLCFLIPQWGSIYVPHPG